MPKRNSQDTVAFPHETNLTLIPILPNLRMVFSSSGHISIVSICVALLVGFFVSGPALLEASLVISLSMLALLQLFLVFPFMDTNPASLGSRAATRLEQSCQFASPQEAISAQPINALQRTLRYLNVP